ncbi:hypothetical protein M199_gp233 [Halogranum tailed virus 1]|uniref:Uncharacterized protein n=1 Tax=Halogranum tailed virus 1 TaxID=1273749 RepID=R4TMN9_9CAUD|nr:hypothetical protein M199_gp233 [Halogranum tailed virus 1]AGM11433.1 hypothetical protein HGTV1_135 [Halogranum tailed virus 1]
MYEIMIRYPMLIDGEFKNMFRRKHWKVNNDGQYLAVGNETNGSGWPTKDEVRIPMRNVIGWTEIEE